MKQLSPQDAQFLYMESEHHLTHGTIVMIFDPSTVPDSKPVRFKDIIAHIAKHVDSEPMLRHKMVRVPLELDYPYWVDDEYFDIEYHMSHSRLPEPGDWRQLCIHLSRYHTRPLDMHRPLWEMYVVEGLDNVEGMAKGSYALAIKIHHSVADGASMLRFFGAIMDSDNLGTPAVPLQDHEVELLTRPSLLTMAKRAVRNNLRSPIQMAEALRRNAPAMLSMALGAVGQDNSAALVIPKTRFNGTVSPHRMLDAEEMELAELKAIRKLVPQSTINDVVLTLCGGALRKYLSHHNELPEDSLVTTCPVNIRPGGATDSDAPGNNISAMRVPVFTNVSDSVERLAQVYEATKVTKEAQSGQSMGVLTDLTKHVPAVTQVMASRLMLMSGVASRISNLFVSNVPGPQQQLYMNGAKQRAMFGIAPLGDGLGLFVGVTSYNGILSFNVSSTREMMPDIEFFMDCLRETKDELMAATINQKGK